MSTGHTRSGMIERELSRRLRAAAVTYTQRGWPILPLSPAGDRPVARLSPADQAMACEWWSEWPYGIGCRLGTRLDALQVPAEVGTRVLDRVRRQHQLEPPVIEVPAWQCWMFFVTPGAPRILELVRYEQVRLHSRGAWVPLPPTNILDAETRWVNEQDCVQLPHSLTAQWILRGALRPPTTTSTTRRGRRNTAKPPTPTPAGAQTGA